MMSVSLVSFIAVAGLYCVFFPCYTGTEKAKRQVVRLQEYSSRTLKF